MKIKILETFLSNIFHPTLNVGLDETKISIGSNKKVYWLCENNHVSYCRVSHKYNGTKCPYCNNKKPTEHYNLETINPELSKQWDYSKNEKSPSLYLPNSHSDVWWVCDNNHSWKQSINARKTSECPHCKKVHTSLPEQIFYYYLSKHLNYTIHNRYFISNIEIDIYIEELKIGIEYDGYYFHKNKYEQDLLKTNRLKELGISLIRIRESGLNEILNCFNIIILRKDYQTVLNTVCNYLNIRHFMIDLKRDNQEILKHIKQVQYESSIEFLNTELSRQWDYSKNKDLKPSMFRESSDIKVWWLCEHSHSWEATIGSRKHTNCPYCTHQKTTTETSIVTTNPKLLEEWDYEKNIDIDPKDCFKYSNISVYWKCKNNHSWKARISNRSNNDKCPYCTGKVCADNNITITHPDIAKEWNFDKNLDIPENYTYGMVKKVWWKCENNHEFESYINNRCKRNSKCPLC